MPNNQLNTVSQRIASQIADDLRTFIPDFSGEIADEIVQRAISAGVNITLHAFKQSLKFNVQETLIKKYLRENVKGYK